MRILLSFISATRWLLPIPVLILGFPSAASGETPTAAGLISDLATGKAISGVDPSFSPDKHVLSGHITRDDPRAVLGLELMRNNELSAQDRALYQGALAYYCFGVTRWIPKKDYPAYLYCAAQVGSGPQKFKDAASQKFAGQPAEIDNLLVALNRGLSAKRKIDPAMLKLEKAYPRLKKLYRDTARQAASSFAARQKSFADILSVVAPITARLSNNAEAPSPPECEKDLLAQRAKLKQIIKPKDSDGVRELTAGHPVGYQITEALAYCYLHTDKLAKAHVEGLRLREANRRVTRLEELFFAEQVAHTKVRHELRSRKQFQAVIPTAGWGLHWILGPDRFSPQFAAWASRKADLQTRGDSERKPAVVQSIEKTEAGTMLAFKKYESRYTYQPTDCQNTKQILRYDIETNGATTSVVPVYKQACKKVGAPKTERIVYQENAVTVDPRDAVLIKTGMQVEVLLNTKKPGDATVVEAWIPKKGRSKEKSKHTIVNGVAL